MKHSQVWGGWGESCCGEVFSCSEANQYETGQGYFPEDIEGGIVLVRANGEHILFDVQGYHNTAHQLPFEEYSLLRIFSMAKPSLRTTSLHSATDDGLIKSHSLNVIGMVLLYFVAVIVRQLLI